MQEILKDPTTIKRSFSLRLEASLYKKIEELAHQNKRNFSNQVYWLIYEALKDNKIN